MARELYPSKAFETHVAEHGRSTARHRRVQAYSNGELTSVGPIVDSSTSGSHTTSPKWMPRWPSMCAGGRRARRTALIRLTAGACLRPTQTKWCRRARESTERLPGTAAPRATRQP